MMKGTESTCVNHPATHATARCKMCSKPLCDACIVPGPVGVYCSTVCKDKHTLFQQRVQTMDQKGRGSSFVKAKSAITTLIVFLAILFAIGFLASTIEIPVVSDITYKIRDLIGI